jgi:hypothetical protein
VRDGSLPPRPSSFRKRRARAIRIQRLLQTRAVPTFTLYAALRPELPADDVTVDALGDVLRPGDDDVRIWWEADRGLLRVSTECAADDLDAALDLGHELGGEALAACPGALLEVGALGDEDSLVWRAVP